MGGGTTKATACRDQDPNQQVLRVFAFMKGKMLVIHMAHSVGTFYQMSGMATNVQGKQIVVQW